MTRLILTYGLISGLIIICVSLVVIVAFGFGTCQPARSRPSQRTSRRLRYRAQISST